MKPLLEIQNLSLIYHSPTAETEALKSVNFNVANEEFVSIVGPSGCGKTTILSLIAGLIEPSEGSILYCGDPISSHKGIAALMPQKDQLFEWRTISRNVSLGLEIRKIKTAENLAYADELLKKYGLSDFAKMRPSELSGGMRQRAALIRTLVTSPKILLLDEPFSSLDFQTRLNVCNDVHAIIKEEKKSTILVTHDISEAISMSDKVIVLTARPATVKKIYEIVLDKNKTPLERREQKAFGQYFKNIWRDLEVKDV